MKIRKRVSLLLVAVLLLLMTLPAAAAAPEDQVAPTSSSYLTMTGASVAGGNGSITVKFYVVAKGPMTHLGAIQIQVVDYATNKVVKTFYSNSTSGMMTSNKVSFAGTVTYTGATPGKKYYASVLLMAGDSAGGDSRYVTTGLATAT